ncbi:hypothetical protein [Polaribacter sp. Z022]|nr:hypothetical protein [Polaribacter sp. Z022]MCL7752472.1 hypothetical protein [Polaribacter sp. Z022]
MKNLNDLNVTELTIEEKKSIEGGLTFLGLLGIGFLIGIVVGIIAD